MLPYPLAQHGFTVVELLVALTITVILLGLGVPAFNDYLARKRLEGVFNELQTDLQFARSEAVSRNLRVRMTFGTGCYVIHTYPSPGSYGCTQTGPSTIPTGSVELRTLQVQPGTSPVLSPNDSLTRVEFEPLRGGASWDGSGAQASVNVNSNAGTWQLRAAVTAAGRVQGCSPGDSVPGYASC